LYRLNKHVEHSLVIV